MQSRVHFSIPKRPCHGYHRLRAPSNSSPEVRPITASNTPDRTLSERLRDRFGSRAAGLIAALALEALLILLLLTLGYNAHEPERSGAQISTFDVRPAPEVAQAEPESDSTPQDSALTRDPEEAVPELQPDPVVPEAPAAPAPPPAVVLPRDNALSDFDLSDLPRRRPDRPESNAPLYGPSLPPSSSSDTEIVGTAPDGEPLYAARWFREPTDQQLRGYLSTAQPGSYALIACKTVPDWRVQDCVGLEEYPKGSNLQRAVLAAAWQFEVRPPRRGNNSLVGAWVRIRIDYRRGNAGSF